MLNDLSNKGYPKTALPNIKWENGEILITNVEEKFDNFEQYLENLMNILNIWNDKIEELYKKEYLSTFFHGRQLNLLWNYFNGNDDQNESEINLLFKYMIDNPTKSLNFDKIKYQYDNKMNLIENFPDSYG